MKKLIYPAFIASVVFFSACTASQVQQTVNDVMNASQPVSTTEVANGLKEALTVGISKGASQAAQTDGYFKNPRIKIPFPQDVQRVETKLRQIGLGNEVDKFILTLNRGAEDAATQAKPIFINAIKSMTIADAWAILKGDKDAATQYLKRTTSSQLQQAFQPVIKNSLDKVNATRYYADIINTYNQIPLVQKVNPDLESYATQKAIDGLFILVAEEEARIRENPLARTTELLRRVFAEKNQS
ncbi:MAG: DUF4197 domain-containing protein [Hymenobacteraceae bacterium]|nr:DUF4197 domain-containing protein [Hymenobacteraceae bacterium]MDX5395884.1 DUF4197 domain-containing protein [Hymenobacteraceae bacterium]MDX5442527.1 DUF4197 domain-containing protein [Hymenobacteraceae bacterium]MDX5511939.1 DUF4197 domain-containing protein [Hymenobacteraceae bacterium]